MPAYRTPFRIRHVQLTGGWKIIRDVCVDCTNEHDDDNRSTGSRNSRKSAASSGSRKSASRGKSSSKGRHGRVDCSDTDSESTPIRHRRSRKKDASHRDSSERNGKESTRGGSVKRGGSVGSSRNVTEKQRHERKKQLGTENNVTADDQRQQALKEYKDMYNKTARVVKNMIFTDVFGDLGRYTGEVNDMKIPHGMGDIVYDDGLVEGGTWVSPRFLFCIPPPSTPKIFFNIQPLGALANPDERSAR
jgi:hypothetical protein